MSYAGIALVVSNQIGASAEGRLFLFGVLLVFASALCYAVYLVAGSQVVKRVGSMRFTAYTHGVATVPAVVQFFVARAAERARPAGQRLGLRHHARHASAPCCRCSCRPRRCGASAPTDFALIGASARCSVAITERARPGRAASPRCRWSARALVISGVLLVSLKKELDMDLGISGKTALVCAATRASARAARWRWRAKASTW